MVAAHLHAWTGAGYRHIPAGASFGVLDTSLAGRSAMNRWNEPGDATFYIAGDRGVAMAEFARHLSENFSPALRPAVIERALYRLEVRLRAVLDLRDRGVRRAVGLADDLRPFLDLTIARATATFVRRTSVAEALLAPSMAFLDDPARWNLVLFLEKLPRDLASFITATYDGAFRLESA